MRCSVVRFYAIATPANINPLCYTKCLFGFSAVEIQYAVLVATPRHNFDDAMVWLRRMSRLSENLSHFACKIYEPQERNKSFDEKCSILIHVF
jgi:hypothetical protein